MVGQDRYNAHLKVATEMKEVGIAFLIATDGSLTNARNGLS